MPWQWWHWQQQQQQQQHLWLAVLANMQQNVSPHPASVCVLGWINAPTWMLDNHSPSASHRHFMSQFEALIVGLLVLLLLKTITRQ